jgi:hypothetical protein
MDQQFPMPKASEEITKLKREVATLKRRVARLETEDLGAPMTASERRSYLKSLEEERKGELVDFDQWYQRRFS